MMILCSSYLPERLRFEDPVDESRIFPLKMPCEIKNESKPLKRKVSIAQEESWGIFPLEIFQLIFLHANHATLRVGFLMCKRLLDVLQDPKFIKEKIYRTEAFGNTQWALRGGNKIVLHENMDEEFQSLSLFIDEFMKRNDLSSKKMANLIGKGLFIRIPKALTPENIGSLIKPFFPNSSNGYHLFYPPNSQEEIYDSYWIWASGKEVRESQGKRYPIQQDITVRCGYQHNRVVEIIAWLFVEYIRSGKWLCNKFWVRCIDKRGDNQSAVGVGFGESGIDLCSDGPNSNDNSFAIIELLRSNQQNREGQGTGT